MAEPAAPALPARRARSRALDALDRQIIAALRIDGRAQSTAIGEALGQSGNLVANRIRAMDAAGVMRVVAIADFRVHGYGLLARIRLQIHGRSPLAVAQELAERDSVLAVHITSGRYAVSCIYAFAHAREMVATTHDLAAELAGVDDIDVELLNTIYRYRPAIGPIARDAGTA